MKLLSQFKTSFNYTRCISYALAFSLVVNPLALQAQSVSNSEEVDNKKVIAAKTADLEFYSLSNKELIEKIEEYLKELNELDELIESGELTQEEADILRDSLLTKVNNGSRIAGGLGILALVGLLAGGSDGDSDSTPAPVTPITPITPTNTAPSITSGSSFNINEGLSSVGNITATDADSNILIFSISGDDSSSFLLTNSAEKSVNLSFKNPPDFETKSSYSINVRVSDGSLSDSQDITVSINDINDESPIFTSLSSFSINENQTAVGSIAATDADAGDSILYAITGGSDSDSFKVTSEDGLLAFKTAPDFETQSSFSLEVTATDTADNFTKQNVSVNIIDLNDNNPVFTSSNSFSVAEGTDAVATLTGSDADGDSVSFSSTLAGDDAADFTLSSSGTLAFAATPNFEAPADADTNNVYSIIATITDGTNTSTQAIAITVTDTNDNSPVFTSASSLTVVEGSLLAGTITASDADENTSVSFSLSGTDSNNFTLSNSGILNFVVTPDFENPADANTGNDYSLIVTASDGLNTTSQNLTVTVSDSNDESPIFTSVSSYTVAENQTAVGILTATDADALEAITFAITGGADSASFKLTGSTLAFASAPDFETQQSYVVVVTASDTNATNTTTQEITVNLTNVNDIAPVITSADAFSVTEGTDAVATLTGSDAEGDSVSFSSTLAGADAADFTLSSSGALAFAATPNFEAPADAGTDNVYNITATITDGTNTSTQAITVIVTDTNDSTPVLSVSTPYSVAENTTTVGTVTAADADANSTITYTLSGTDAAKFDINSASGAISFASAPDFEAPGSAASSNAYSLNVVASDGTNSDTEAVVVNVTDTNDNSPVFTSASSFTVAENITAVGSITATDADAGTSVAYAITGGADSGSFTLTSGALAFTSKPDFETQQSYVVVVTASDGSNTTTQEITVNLTNVNDIAPVFTSADAFSVAEGGTAIATLTGSDADGDSVSFNTTLSGTDAGDFALTTTGILTFASASDFEAPADAGTNNVYNITATITDGVSAVAQDITVTVTDINDNSPVLSVSTPYSVAEGTTSVATVTATDADANSTITYTLSGTDAADFDINSASGAISFATTPDFEDPADANTDNEYLLNVVASDGTNSDTEAVVVNVTDVNDNSPVFTSSATFRVNENQTTIGSISATDADANSNLVYSLTDALTNNDFALSSSGAFTFANSPDFEQKTSYEATVSVTDGVNVTTQNVTVNINNISDVPPVFTSAPTFTVQEGNTAVGNIQATDVENESITFTVSGTDAADFTLTTGGALTFKATPDFEDPADSNTDNIYNILVTATDSTNTRVQTVTVTVTDTNDEAPVLTVNTPYSVAEGTTSVGTVSTTDADANSTITYTLSGTDAADFDINSASGAITFATTPDFEDPADADTNNSYSLSVTASDGTNSDTEALVVNVTAVNDNSPVFTSASSFTVAENQTAVGSLTATDADAGTTVTFTTTGGADKDAFTVTGSTLAFASAPNYEAQQSYVVVVTASDGSNTTTQEITVNLTNVNDIAPVFTSANAFSVAEGTDAVATLTGSDAEGDSVSFSTTLTGTDAADFGLTAGGVLTFAATPNFESPVCGTQNNSNTCNVIATITDGTNTSTQAITVTVTDTNDEAPVLSVSTPYSVAEGTTSVGTVSTTDADANSTITYTLTGTDAAKFDINSASGAISFVSAPDFETPGSGDSSNAYSLNVVASDGTNSDTEAVVVNVTAVNDNSPVFTSASSFTVAEEQTAVGSLTTTDADTGTNTVTFTTTGGADKDAFTVTGSTLAFASAPDYEAQQSYVVVVTASDGSNTTTQEITVNLTNVNDIAPVFTSANAFSVAEGTDAVATLTGSDAEGDSVSFSTTLTGTDAGDFTLNSSGALAFAATPNFESPVCGTQNNSNTCNVIATITDGTNTSTQAITVTVTDTNDEAPVLSVSTPYSVAEGTTSVGTVSTTDADANSTITYTLTGTDAAKFDINSASGAISFVSAPDFETPGSGDSSNAYSLNVVASDGTNSDTEAVVVNVTAVNDNSPVFTSASSFTVAEEQTAVGSLTTTDADTGTNTVTFTTTGGADKDAFTVTGSTLAFASAPNYEAQQTYVVVVTASDGSNTTTQEITVNLTNVNDIAPVFTSANAFSVAEGTDAVATLTGSDAEGDSVSFSTTLTGTDAGDFTLNSSGALAFAATPNFESPVCGTQNNSNTCNVIATITDGTNTSTQAITVTVTDINDSTPVLSVSTPYSVAEGTTSVATVTATDADANSTITYTLTGTDAAKFDINSASGAISFVSAPDFETPGSGDSSNAYSLNVVASDGTNSDTEAVVVNVTAVNDNSPVFTSASSFTVAEEQTAVGSLTTTDADTGTNTVTFTTTGGADKDAFTVTGSTLAFASAPDYEAQQSYVVVVTASDGSNTTTQEITVNLTNVNDIAPVFTSANAFSVAEGTDAVATLTGSDAEGDSVTFSIVLGGSGVDAGDFTLSSSGALAFAATPNFEVPADNGTDNVYNIIAVITDGTNTSNQAITITVTDTNDNSPVLSVSTPYSVAENTTTVGTVTAADADANSTITYTLTGTDAAKFDINSASGAISFVSAPDFEAPGSADSSNAYSLNVVASDGTNSDTEAVVVNVTAVNDNSPAFTSASSFTVAEEQTAVGTLAATDADAGTTVTFAITGGADSDSFTLNSPLAFKAAPDFETQQSYVVVVTASDGSNTTTQEITVNLTNVNDIAPVFTSANAFSVAEGTDAVATLTGLDAEGDSVSFSTTLTGTDAGDFTLNSSGALAFAATPNFESPVCGTQNNSNTCNVIATITDGTNTSTQAITVTVTDINDSTPVLSVSTPYSVAEGTTSVATVTATDADANSTITYTLSGTDAADFDINSASGAISFATTPDFEDPADANTDNEYLLNVVASDGTNSDTEAVVVNVTAVNDNSPVFTSASSFTVAEEQTAVGSLTTTDADTGTNTVTFTTTGGADKDAFTVTGSTLAFASAPNYEAQQTYVVVVTASDGSNTTTQEITVNLTNVNDIAPVFASSSDAFSVAEGTDAVATLTGSDAEGDSVSFSTTLTGTDAADFGLTAGGVLTFAATPNFESPADADTNNVYSITATITDGTNTSTQAITVTVTDVNEAPVLSVATPYSVAEGTTAVGTVTTTDADAGTTLTYSLTGTDKDDFTITKTGAAQNGVIAFSSAPDFETKTAYSLNVVVSDGTNTTTEAIVVNVTDVNDNSPALTVNTPYSVAEGTTAVGTVTTTDGDAGTTTLTYSLTGTDKDDFTITKTGEAQNGVIAFSSAPDFETKTAYSLNVVVSDGTNTTTEAIVVNVTNVNDNSPVLSVATPYSVAEGQTAVGTVTTTDADAGTTTLTYSLSGTDADDFTITKTGEAQNGVITFDAAPDFETKTAYSLNVLVSDGTTTTTEAIVVNITNVNEAPVIGSSSTFSQPENTIEEFTVAATDVDASSSIVYSISGGTDGARFQINTSTGVLQFSGFIPNFEAPLFSVDNDYEVEVTASDGSLTTSQTITFTVTDVNEAPALTVNTPYSVAEGTTAVGTVTTTDVDAGTTTFTYSLSGTDADDFTITKTGAAQNGVIAFSSAPDFETKTAYSLNVLVSDGTNTTTKAIVVNVTNVNDNSPVLSVATPYSVAEGTTAVGTVTTTDGDAGTTTFTYSLSGTDADDFTITKTGEAQNGVITFDAAPDFETKTAYSLNVLVSDGTNTTTEAIVVNVTNVNDNSPVLTVNTPYSVAEGTTAVGTVTTTDADAGTTTLTYSLTGTDAGDFTITKTGVAQNGVIAFSSAPDFETKTAYSLNVLVSDGTTTTTEAIIVNVTNVNEAPVLTVNTPYSVAEGTTAVGTVTTTDADAGTTLTYSLTGTDADDFTITKTGEAQNGVITFDAAPDFETKTAYSLNVLVSDGTTTTTEAIVVNITNVNDNSPVLSVATPYSVAEGQTAVGTVTTTDGDAGTTTFTYSLSGTDADDFTITKTGEAQNGVITFDAAPDFETKTAYSLNVLVSDGTNTTTEAIVVNVTNINDNNPVFTSSTSESINEGQTSVSTVEAGDADGNTIAYSIDSTGREDHALFTINSSTGALTMTARDFENPTDDHGTDDDNVYGVTVKATDNGTPARTATHDISVTVVNVNDNSPALTVNTPYSVAEGTTAVGTVTTTDGDAGTTTLTYSLTGTDKDDFTITKTGEAQNGVIAFSSAPDFETKTAYSLNVVVSDGTNTTTEAIVVNVTNVNDNSPVLSVATPYSVAEGQTAVGTVTTTDGDAGTTTLTYSLSGTDADDFTITKTGEAQNGVITFDAAPDFETKTAYSLNVVVSDGTNTTTEAIVVNVTNVNEAPVITTTSFTNIPEEQATIGNLAVTDDASDSISYAITGGADRLKFSVSGAALSFSANPNFEIPGDADGNNVYVVEITATDGGGLTDIETVSVTVVNANDAPVITTTTFTNISEEQTAVGTLAATDADSGDSITFAISGGADRLKFSAGGIGGSTLAFNGFTPDFDSPGSADSSNTYEVQITATDNGTGALTDVQTITVVITDLNDNSPALTVNTPYSVAEGTTAVGTVTTTDADAGTTLTYSLTGTDKDDFTITKTGAAQNGVIAFSSAPDFETKTAYSLNVVVSDGTNTTTEAIVVNVTNVNDNSPVLSVATPYSVAEGQTAVGTVTTTDADAGTTTLTYSLTGTDADDFTITKTGEAQNGVIAFSSAPDFETKTAYSLNVLVSDGTTTTTEAIVVNVTNINDNNPVFTSSTSESINEGQTSVSTVEAGDADGNTIAYSIDSTGREDHALFTINSSTGALTMTARDFENPTDDHGTDDDNVYGVTVKATDNGTPARTATHDISVTVVNVNDNSPALTVNTPYSVAEGTTAVGTVTTTDGDAGTTTLTYSLTGTDKDDFTITKTGEAQNGVIAFSSAPDFETKTAYSLNVVVSDGTNTTTEAIVVNVTNVNDNSPVLSVATPYSVAEGQTAVGTVTTTDADAGTTTFTYSLSGTDADDFTITKTGEAQNGVITFDAAPDFETKTAYSLNVLVSDGTTTTTEAIVVNITNVNEAPVLTVNTPYSVAEGTTAVGTVTTTDADAGTTLTYSLTGTDASDFTITKTGEAQNGVIAFKGSSTPDFETKTAYSLNVLVSDGTTTTTEAIVVNITNVNDNSPVLSVATPYSVAEGTTAVGTVTTTDGDAGTTTFTYSLSGTDAGDFTITKTGEAQNGVIAFSSAPDFETKTAYSLNVLVSDGTTTTTEAIVVNVTNVNEAPVLTVNTPYSVAEGTTAVGTVTTTDADAGTTLTYSLTGTDAGDFTITKTGAAQNGVIAFSSAPDFETKTAYSLNVLVSDGTNTTTEAIVVNVTNVNDNSPVLSVATPYSVAEGQTAVGTVTTTDADAGTTFTYSLTGTDADDFTITKTGAAQNGVITFDAAPDFETKTAYSLNVLVSDGTNTTTEAIVVNVTNVNEAPVITTTSFTNIPEEQATIGNLAVTDDASDSISYAITGGADRLKFSVSGAALSFSANPNFEIPGDADGNNVYVVEITATDGGGLTDIETVSVTVVNANEAPTITASATYSVAENTTAVGNITGTDIDSGDAASLTFTLSGVDSAKFAVTPLFTSGNNRLASLAFQTAPDAENATDNDSNNVYVTTITVEDAQGATVSQADIAITVTGTNDNSPVFTSTTAFSVDEGTTTSFATLSATDADTGTSIISFSINGGADASAFSLTGGTGLKFASAPDFDNPTDVGGDNIYSVTIQASDGLNTTNQTITVFVQNTNNETPRFSSPEEFNALENQTAVGTVTTVDDEGDEILYTISAGVDKDLFQIDVNTGVLTFIASPDFENPLDSDADNIYIVEVMADDQRGHKPGDTSINRNYNTSTAYKTMKVNVIDVFEEDDGEAGVGLSTIGTATGTATATSTQ